jgi:hypothetical protein
MFPPRRGGSGGETAARPAPLRGSPGNGVSRAGAGRGKRLGLIPRAFAACFGVRSSQATRRSASRSTGKARAERCPESDRARAAPVDVLGLGRLGDGAGGTPRFREDEVAGRGVEPRQRVVGGDVGEPPPGDGHRLGRDPVRVPAPSPPRVGRDGAEVGEDHSEARLGGLAIGLDVHAGYCRNGPPALHPQPNCRRNDSFESVRPQLGEAIIAAERDPFCPSPVSCGTPGYAGRPPRARS